METKAQKAVLAKIEEYIKRIEKAEHESWTEKYCEEMDKLIEEYFGVKKGQPLSEGSLKNLVEKAYEALMKKGFYEVAASFAKKYGL